MRVCMCIYVYRYICTCLLENKLVPNLENRHNFTCQRKNVWETDNYSFLFSSLSCIRFWIMYPFSPFNTLMLIFSKINRNHGKSSILNKQLCWKSRTTWITNKFLNPHIIQLYVPPDLKTKWEITSAVILKAISSFPISMSIFPWPLKDIINIKHKYSPPATNATKSWLSHS